MSWTRKMPNDLDFTYEKAFSEGLEARGFEPLTSSLQSWRSTN
jgi:hypothetical protein